MAMRHAKRRIHGNIHASLYLAAAVAAIPALAAAQTTDWTGTNSTSWSDPGNWDNGVPTNAGENVNITSTTDTVNYDYGVSPTLGTVTISTALTSNPAVGLSISASPTLSFTAASEFVGDSGASPIGGQGTFTQSCGVNDITTGSLLLGVNAADVGSYTLSGTGSLAVISRFVTSELVGVSGTGTFLQTGGNQSTNVVYIGYNAGSSGTYVQSGGSNQVSSQDLQNNSIVVGYSAGAVGSYTLGASATLTSDSTEVIGSAGNGAFDQTGGANMINPPDINAALDLGRAAGSMGSYSLSRGTLQVTSNEVVGDAGTGAFNQSAGTNAILNGEEFLIGLNIGNSKGSFGSYTLGGTGVLTGAAYEIIGGSGLGVFEQTGGSNTAGLVVLCNSAGSTGTYIQSGGSTTITDGNPQGGALVVGSSTGSTGSYTLTGSGTLTAIEDNEIVGHSGTGVFDQIGGLNNISGGGLELGDNTGSTGTYLLSGGGTLLTRFISVGSGTLDQSSGSINAGVAGENIGTSGNGTYIQSGGVNINQEALFVGVNAGSTGTYIQTGGTNTIGDGLLFLGMNKGSVGSYSLSGTGTLNVTSINVGSAGGGRGNLTLSGVQLNIPGNLVVYTASSVNVNGGMLTTNHGVTLNGAYVQTSGSASFPNVTGSGAMIISGGQVSLAAMAITEQIGGLSVTGTGTLDVANNALAVNYGAPAADPVSSIAAALTTAAAPNTGGVDTWSGTGITSSLAESSNNHLTLGYLDGNNPIDAQFGTVAANQILIKYTIVGDAFLRGYVGFDDLITVAEHYGQTGQDYAEGNLNYDPTGSVGFADLVDVAMNYGQYYAINFGSPGGGGVISLAWQLQPTAVNPEPASLALPAFALCLTRRRRHKC